MKGRIESFIKHQAHWFAIAVFIIWVSFLVLVVSTGEFFTIWGPLGDSFGAVNALFSALAFAGLIYTASLQMEELKGQKEQLELQKNELSDTNKAFREQNSTLKQQRFENTFFQLISIHHDIVAKLSLTHIDKKREGRELLTLIKGHLYNHVNPAIKARYGANGIEMTKRPTSAEDAIQQIRVGYMDFYHEHDPNHAHGTRLNHYYRNLYHIFKFIHHSKLIEDGDRQFYASIARAQLSSDELFLILYNSFIEGMGYPKFLFLIREFGLMENFDHKLIDGFSFHWEAFEHLQSQLPMSWNQLDEFAKRTRGNPF